MIKNYNLTLESLWEGRVDSEDDFSGFRWHQWVKMLDLNDKNLKPFKGKLGIVFLGFESDTGVKLNKGRTGAAKRA